MSPTRVPRLPRDVDRADEVRRDGDSCASRFQHHAALGTESHPHERTCQPRDCPGSGRLRYCARVHVHTYESPRAVSYGLDVTAAYETTTGHWSANRRRLVVMRCAAETASSRSNPRSGSMSETGERNLERGNHRLARHVQSLLIEYEPRPVDGAATLHAWQAGAYGGIPSMAASLSGLTLWCSWSTVLRSRETEDVPMRASGERRVRRDVKMPLLASRWNGLMEKPIPI